jgi:hypothetical protein
MEKAASQRRRDPIRVRREAMMKLMGVLGFAT